MLRKDTVADIYLGEFGNKELIIETFTDLSNASEIKIIYKKPISGTIGEWSASINSNKPTQVKYVIQENDIDEAGIWTLHVKAIYNSNNNLAVNIGDAFNIVVSDLFKRT